MALAQGSQMSAVHRSSRARATAPPMRHRASPAAVRPLRTVATRATSTSVDAGRWMPRWPICYEYLRTQGLETVAPKDAATLAESGKWVVVDVRRADQHAAAAPRGAINIPLYQKLEAMSGGFDPTKALKAVMFAFNGVEPIEPNPEFVRAVSEVAAGGKGVIFACEAGGTMKPSVNFAVGKASRSLQACYKALSEAGVKEVKHLDRGIFGWYQANLPFTGEYKPEIGRFPMAASEPTIRGTADDKKAN